MDELPAPRFSAGDRVLVLANGRNTPREGVVRAITWHAKDKCWYYLIRQGTRKLSKRYPAEDLQAIGGRTGEPIPIFRWETLRDDSAFIIPYREPILGRTLTVELVAGATVSVFRADDLQMYFCHGLTFGSLVAPGGAVPPFSGAGIQQILSACYDEVFLESDARAGDALVWHDFDGGTPHSAILAEAVMEPGSSQLDPTSQVRTKNGRRPEEVMSLGRLTGEEFEYGDSFKIYRRKIVREVVL